MLSRLYSIIGLWEEPMIKILEHVSNNNPFLSLHIGKMSKKKKKKTPTTDAL